VSTSVRHKHWWPRRDPLPTKDHTLLSPFQLETEPLTGEMYSLAHTISTRPGNHSLSSIRGYTTPQNNQLHSASQYRPLKLGTKAYRASTDTEHRSALQENHFIWPHRNLRLPNMSFNFPHVKFIHRGRKSHNSRLTQSTIRQWSSPAIK